MIYCYRMFGNKGPGKSPLRFVAAQHGAAAEQARITQVPIPRDEIMSFLGGVQFFVLTLNNEMHFSVQT